MAVSNSRLNYLLYDKAAWGAVGGGDGKNGSDPSVLIVLARFGSKTCVMVIF